MDDFDLYLQHAVYGGRQGTFGLLMLVLTLIGEGWTAALLVPLLAYRPTRRFAFFLTTSVATQAVLVWAIKATVGRVRPWIALGLPPPFGSPHDGSFPSGHASGSFCVWAYLVVVLPILGQAHPARVRIGLGAGLVLAVGICLSRVYLGAHWPTDVLAGAALGGGIGAWGARRYRADRGERGNEGR